MSSGLRHCACSVVGVWFAVCVRTSSVAVGGGELIEVDDNTRSALLATLASSGYVQSLFLMYGALS